MKFTLKSPCKNCPFRSDNPQLKGWLGSERARQIDNSLANDAEFPCHLTTVPCEETDNRIATKDSVFCGGALIYMHKQGRLFDNVITRVGVMFKLYLPDDLKMDAPVFDSIDGFVNFHKRGRF